ncbi:MAG: STAS domain-containing protein [Verrucomicrobiia bacterium]|jgi:anti-anti-sigma factor
MRGLQIKWNHVSGVEVIEMTGALDAVAFTQFGTMLMRRMEEFTPCIVLECSHVTYIGSAQLKELISFAHHARVRGGDLKYVGLPQAIQQLANLVAMSDLMEFYNDLPQALQAFRLPVVGSRQPSTPPD